MARIQFSLARLLWLVAVVAISVPDVIEMRKGHMGTLDIAILTGLGIVLWGIVVPGAFARNRRK